MDDRSDLRRHFFLGTKAAQSEVLMVTQRQVLTFVAERSARGRPVGADDVRDKLWLSLDAAAGHLHRLWRERLIQTTSARQAHFRLRLIPGESITSLHFRMTARGHQRLRWYEAEEQAEGGLLPFL